jgi:hypothetical protein
MTSFAAMDPLDAERRAALTRPRLSITVRV